MKTHTHVKSKGMTRVNNQQVVFELKHRVVLGLNKLADRDTYQIGVDELEKIVECLTPDGVAPFLSCILDTDSELKSAVRKECIRMMGMLVSFHGGIIGPHLGKMMASIVKRLKDPDSVVRDACVETVGILASKLSNGEGESDAVFVALVKPLFEALGEQNKQVQSGSALCLARIIDNTNDPPLSILHRMLTRIIKLLKNPHFMAKPAIIELNRSIIQAGGASTQNVLSAAIGSIQEALKNSDWTTRKAASVALGEFASSGGSFLGSFKTSCIRSLESCRFDKVKPVRDTVLHALQYWKGLPGPDSPEPSEAGSSIKENFCGGDYSDLTSASDSGWKDAMLKKAATDTIKKRRIPLSVRKTCQNYVENPQHLKANDWNIEIAVSRTHNISLNDVHNEESEGSSVTKTLERTSADVKSMQDIGYGYETINDKQECSSVSNLLVDNFETKFVTVCDDSLEGNRNMLATSQRFKAEEITSEGQIFLAKVQDRRSLDSTVTELSSQPVRGCCLQTANEMVSIRKQLLEIENKQSSLMDLVQVFTTQTMDSLSTIQSKVLGLERVVDRLAQDLVHGVTYSDLASTKLVRKGQNVASPRLSMCTPRPSIDLSNKQVTSTSMKNTEIWEERTVSRSRLSNSAKQDMEIWTDPTAKINRNSVRKGIQNNSVKGARNMACIQTRKTDAVFSPASIGSTKQNGSECKNSLWHSVKGFLCEGDIESAYVEALCYGDELVLVELLDRTGPVLECLSHKTVNDILCILASYFLEQRFLNSVIPWLQQVVDLTTIHGPNYLVLPAKARREFLSAVEEAANMEFSNPAERRSVTQLAMKLHQLWGKITSAYRSLRFINMENALDDQVKGTMASQHLRMMADFASRNSLLLQ